MSSSPKASNFWIAVGLLTLLATVGTGLRLLSPAQAAAPLGGTPAASSTPVETMDESQQAWSKSIAPACQTADDIMGMAVADAVSTIEGSDLIWRAANLDEDTEYIWTADARSDRVNFLSRNDVVVESSCG